MPSCAETFNLARRLKRLQGNWRCADEAVSAWLRQITIDGNKCIDGEGNVVNLNAKGSDVFLEGGRIYVEEFLCRIGKTGRSMFFFKQLP